MNESVGVPLSDSGAGDQGYFHLGIGGSFQLPFKFHLLATSCHAIGRLRGGLRSGAVAGAAMLLLSRLGMRLLPFSKLPPHG